MNWRDIKYAVEHLDQMLDIPAAIKDLSFEMREFEHQSRENIIHNLLFHLGVEARERYNYDPIFKAQINLLAHMAWSTIFDGPVLDPEEQRKRITALGALLKYDTPEQIKPLGRKSGRLVHDLPATQTNLTLGVNPGDVVVLTNALHEGLIEYIECVGPHGQIMRGTGGTIALAWPEGTLWEVLDFTEGQETVTPPGDTGGDDDHR